MLIESDGFLHLTYCTNIHAADGWPAVFENIRQYAPGLKARFAPEGPFGLGLRLGARDARELLDGHLDEFRDWLARHHLYVAIINGFPYGPFHRSVVKEHVYAPDWRDEARVVYTLDLVEILRRLVPHGIDGGVSTAPLSFKRWMTTASEDDWDSIVRNVVRVATGMALAHERDGALLHLDIEPEPDCSIETTAETVAFFEDRLLTDGARLFAGTMGGTLGEARRRLRDHVRVCFDCCHMSVEFENPLEAIARLEGAGIRIGRVQLSSAVRVPAPEDRAAAERLTRRLRPFADATYLHQVKERREGAAPARFPDLDVALADPTPQRDERRIHFHVPLFTRDYDGLDSTQDDVAAVIALAKAQHFTRHLEIETYTWDVLPGALKIDLAESIAREYEWVLAQLR
jgi:sugar phosphate isomerase/epimerase